jgi:ketosteroid isomerase-like protein
MAHDNVERVRQGYEALNDALYAGRDPSEVLADMYDADVSLEMGVLEGTFRGHEGVRRFVEGQVAIIDGLRVAPQEFIAVGGRVIVPFRLSGRVRSTGLPFEARYVHVVTLRGGKAVRVQVFASVAKALEAVELAE